MLSLADFQNLDWYFSKIEYLEDIDCVCMFTFFIQKTSDEQRGHPH